LTVGGSAARSTTDPARSAPLPSFAMVDAQGRPATLADFRGKVVVLNVWATWCAPCRRELPALARLAQALDGDFAVAVLSVDEDALAAREYLAQRGIAVASYLPRQRAQAMQALALDAVPTTFVIAADGRAIARVLGPRDWDSAGIVAELHAVRAGEAP